VLLGVTGILPTETKRFRQGAHRDTFLRSMPFLLVSTPRLAIALFILGGAAAFGGSESVPRNVLSQPQASKIRPAQSPNRPYLAHFVIMYFQ